MNFVATFPGPL